MRYFNIYLQKTIIKRLFYFFWYICKIFMNIQNKKIALITGVTGQDGAYLSEFLLKKGYIVHGIKRRSSLFNTDRIDHLYQDPHVENKNFILHYGDMTDSTNLIRLIQEIQPDEIYNLAAMSHVAVSFEAPEYTGNADGLGTLRILDAVRVLGLEHKKVGVEYFNQQRSEEDNAEESVSAKEAEESVEDEEDPDDIQGA